MAKKYTAEELDTIEEQFRELIEGQDRCFVVVDSSLTARKNIVNALQKAGAEIVEEAKDGHGALSMLGKIEGSPVVITELNLSPSMDGLVFLKTLRQDETLKETPVVLVTAESRKDKIIAAIKLGVKACLKKPVQGEQVVAKLQETNLL